MTHEELMQLAEKIKNEQASGEERANFFRELNNLLVEQSFKGHERRP